MRLRVKGLIWEGLLDLTTALHCRKAHRHGHGLAPLPPVEVLRHSLHARDANRVDEGAAGAPPLAGEDAHAVHQLREAAAPQALVEGLLLAQLRRQAAKPQSRARIQTAIDVTPDHLGQAQVVVVARGRGAARLPQSNLARQQGVVCGPGRAAAASPLEARRLLDDDRGPPGAGGVLVGAGAGRGGGRLQLLLSLLSDPRVEELDRIHARAGEITSSLLDPGDLGHHPPMQLDVACEPHGAVTVLGLLLREAVRQRGRGLGGASHVVVADDRGLPARRHLEAGDVAEGRKLLESLRHGDLCLIRELHAKRVGPHFARHGRYTLERAHC
mmetsp:Transcript_66913/g.172283  ORF Transcript_66913/g.172283 Transcript_66913/m.172283 type:complete len:328 (-) Transcript_66913:100-1083(-)